MEGSKKVLLIWSVVFICSSICLGGCSDSLLNPKQPVVLTMWHVYGAQTNSAMSELVGRFNGSIGREEGIVINVSAVIDANSMHSALVSAAWKVPGAGEAPDLFTCYPQTILAMGADKVIDWNNWFSVTEREEYIPEFLEEGQVNGKQVIFPIGKASNVLIVNATLFDQFSASTGIGYTSLGTWNGLFEAAEAYYAWSGGKAFFMYDDWMYYIMLNVESLGASFFEGERIDVGSSAFRESWLRLAASAIAGEVCLLKGTVSSAMMTGEVVCGVEASSEIIYYKENVTLADNSTLPLTLVVLPPPLLEGGKALTMLPGVGLGGLKSTKEKEYAAAVFCKWLTEADTNISFALSSGYVPVKKSSYKQIFENKDLFFRDQRAASLYETIRKVHEQYSFFWPPLFVGYAAVKKDFGTATGAILREFRARQLEQGELSELPEESLQALEAYVEQKVLRGH